MPIFMYQLKYTPAAWASFIMKPEDRGAVVDELLKGIGGRLISIYYTTGEWDGLVIYEASGHGCPYGHSCAWPSHGDPDVHAVHDEGHDKGARNGKGAEIPRNSRGVAF